jgi:hypothetical protein
LNRAAAARGLVGFNCLQYSNPQVNRDRVLDREPPLALGLYTYFFCAGVHIFGSEANAEVAMSVVLLTSLARYFFAFCISFGRSVLKTAKEINGLKFSFFL